MRLRAWIDCLNPAGKRNRAQLELCPVCLQLRTSEHDGLAKGTRDRTLRSEYRLFLESPFAILGCLFITSKTQQFDVPVSTMIRKIAGSHKETGHTSLHLSSAAVLLALAALVHGLFVELASPQL